MQPRKTYDSDVCVCVRPEMTKITIRNGNMDGVGRVHDIYIYISRHAVFRVSLIRTTGVLLSFAAALETLERRRGAGAGETFRLRVVRVEFGFQGWSSLFVAVLPVVDVQHLVRGTARVNVENTRCREFLFVTSLSYEQLFDK